MHPTEAARWLKCLLWKPDGWSELGHPEARGKADTSVLVCNPCTAVGRCEAETGESRSSQPVACGTGRQPAKSPWLRQHGAGASTQGCPLTVAQWTKIRCVMWMKATLTSPSLLEKSSPFLRNNKRMIDLSLWAAWLITAVPLWHHGAVKQGPYANEWAWLSSSQTYL